MAAATLTTFFLSAGAGGAAAAPRDDSRDRRATSNEMTSQQRGSEVAQAATGTATQIKDKESQQSQTPPPTIVGGSIAPLGAYPFFASLKRVSTNAAFCGGTLVSTVWVLTAAHCVDGGTTPASLKLVIGANRLDNESPGDVRSVSAIHIHPSWNSGTMENDVALLRLSSPATKPWARMAEPIDPVNPGNTVRAIGHGHQTEGGTISNDLRQVDLPIQSDATMSIWWVYGGRFHGSTMIGAGPMGGGMDTCQGDSGGPLFVVGSQARLVGDTSWGDGCAQAAKPGIYGEVYQGAMRSFVNGLVSRPANNNFAGSAISGADGTVFGRNTDATAQTGEPNAAVNSSATSVWYSWTAPTSGPTSFNTRDAAFDTALGVYTGTSVAALTAVATNDDFNGTFQSKVTFNATAGTTYRIAVGGFAAQHGSFGLQWAQNAPAHDNFATPATISGATGKHFSSNIRSTGEPGEPYHGSIPDRSVWYSWTAPQSGVASFNTREATFDTVIAAYTGTTITSLTQRTFNDQFNGTNQSKITFAVTAGTNYRIAVDGFGGATGSIGLQWTIAAPANDDFVNARILTGTSGASPATTVRSTGEPGEPGYHGGAIADNSVWFAWTPTSTNPAVVRVLGPAGGLLPWMAVYTGTTIGGLTAVASGSTSATFNAVANQRYLIAVDGAGGSTGTFTLEYVLGRCNGLSATMFAGAGTTTGTAGNDVIVGSTVANTIEGGAGNDTICSLSGNDTLSGGAGNDRLYGGTDDDWFREGATASGADVLVGDTGSDSVFYNARTTPVNVTLDAIANDGAAGEGDLVTGAERIYGGSAADTMQGGVAAEMLRGNGGNDTLRGGAGSDTLIGHAGNDRLFGEAGPDALDLIDGVSGNDRGDGGADTDTATLDAGDIVVSVP